MLHVSCCMTFHMPFEIARLFLLLLFGLAVGSFINAFTWRLHEGMSLARGRSMCPSCKVTLSWKELVPIASYILLAGKCASCRVRISPQYPLVEGATAALFALAGSALGSADPVGLAFALASISVLIALFVYDLRWYQLPDVITLPAIVAAFFANGFLLRPEPCLPGSALCFLENPWLNLLFAMAIGGGFFLLQYLISSGRWIGGGDIRMGALMGAMVGYPGILLALFIAYMTGSIVGIGLLLGKRAGMKSEVPFGPFLATATLIVMLFGNSLLALVQGVGFL